MIQIDNHTLSEQTVAINDGDNSALLPSLQAAIHSSSYALEKAIRVYSTGWQKAKLN